MNKQDGRTDGRHQLVILKNSFPLIWNNKRTKLTTTIRQLNRQKKNIRVKKKHAFHANLRNVVIKTSAKKRSASSTTNLNPLKPEPNRMEKMQQKINHSPTSKLGNFFVNFWYCKQRACVKMKNSVIPDRLRKLLTKQLVDNTLKTLQIINETHVSRLVNDIPRTNESNYLKNLEVIWYLYGFN